MFAHEREMRERWKQSERECVWPRQPQRQPSESSDDRGISEATQTRENSLLSPPQPEQKKPIHEPFHLLAKALFHIWTDTTPRKYALKGPFVASTVSQADIWDGGRETEKGTHLDRD